MDGLATSQSVTVDDVLHLDPRHDLAPDANAIKTVH